jgi:imidazolonepropionase-like amidohydrolase
VYREMDLMQQAGLTPMEVLVDATRNGARAMGRGDEFGTLEPGKAGDLVILDADPLQDIANARRVSRVVKDGVAVIPSPP